jgi:hypothetical protein
MHEAFIADHDISLHREILICQYQTLNNIILTYYLFARPLAQDLFFIDASLQIS